MQSGNSKKVIENYAIWICKENSKKTVTKLKKKTKLRKNAIFGKLIENAMKECSHSGRPFKKRTNFVLKQLVLKGIMQNRS